jgi:hypothetical protein
VDDSVHKGPLSVLFLHTLFRPTGQTKTSLLSEPPRCSAPNSRIDSGLLEDGQAAGSCHLRAGVAFAQPQMRMRMRSSGALLIVSALLSLNDSGYFGGSHFRPIGSRRDEAPARSPAPVPRGVQHKVGGGRRL